MCRHKLAAIAFAILFSVSAVSASPSAVESGSSSKSAGSSQALSGKPMAPEFGPSVVFDRADAPVQLSDLRGKMVVEVFFQSWCPVCNGWSPELLQQLQKSFGDDPAVVLVALKVDGGTPAEAKAYLKSKGADLSRWIVASDAGGLYYQRVSGTDALWGYALVDSDGRLIDRGKAGSYYPLPAGKEFVLADPTLKKKSPAAAPIIRIDDSTPAELRPVAHVAEQGHIALALRALKSWERGKTKEAAQQMQATLLDAMASRVEKASADLKSADAETRYDAYSLLLATGRLADTPAGKSAQASLAALKGDKSLEQELATERRAESAFWTMLARSARLEAQQRKAQLPAALEQFANYFNGTCYAARARVEAQTISTGTLAQ